jgi:hypothetical protein
MKSVDKRMVRDEKIIQNQIQTDEKKCPCKNFTNSV